MNELEDTENESRTNPVGNENKMMNDRVFFKIAYIILQ